MVTTSRASGVSLRPKAMRSPTAKPRKSAVEAAMNGIDIFSFINPPIASWSMTITGRVACRSDGGGRMARTVPVPR